MSKRIFIARTQKDLERCFPVMKELRPHLDLQNYLNIYKEAHQTNNYEIAAIEENDKILAVMGYRLLSDYVRGKHIYIDDLVTSESARSKGLGAELLQFAEETAKEMNCHVLRLCTGIENERGVQFYEKNNWTKRAYAYVKKLNF